ncbi:MAG: hypothetical protein P4L46_06740 [Fimbriimonas sp.]|nr:hypothetical protein [Fimbriimonas sp.]
MRIYFAILFAALLSLHHASAFDKQNLVTGWRAYERGFQAVDGMGKTMSVAMVCESSTTDQAFGAQNIVAMDQKAAKPFTIEAWSRAEDVGGTPDDGYSLYLDLNYSDGSHLWGMIAPFDCGTHSWQLRRVRVVPSKPVKEALVYVLLRRHSGKVWFSDVVLDTGAGGRAFDYQPIAYPAMSASTGWFVRDVASGSKLIPAAKANSIGIETTVNGSKLVVRDTQERDRALTLYYCERFDAAGGRWWSSIRSSTPVRDIECANVVGTSSGANRLSSLYPFAAVTTPTKGLMLAIPPSNGPTIARLFYNPGAKLLCAAFDVALTHGNRFHPGTADVEVFASSIDPAWAFRDAARRYYLAYPDAYQVRIPKQGIWIPFTDPALVPHPEDFGIAVHEGDNSVASDDRLGILSFRYTEPMTWWMAMEPSIPRTYENAIDLLNKSLRSANKEIQREAQAVIASGTQTANGRYNISFRNEPWTNGAVWVLNPNPAIPHPAGTASQAQIVYDQAEAKTRYETTKLSGEYLDSLEDHSEVLDYGKESIESSHYSPSFDDAYRPVIPQSYSTYEIARFMSQDLHARGKLLMANSTPRDFPYYMPLIDCAGIEVNWMSGGSWTPDSDDVFDYRRTMCYHKPYMLLQNTDFSKFGSEAVAKYFKKCLFYGVFPSFFSADAATHPYWSDSKLFERDRPLFKKTIPVIRTIATAGWEPVTHATASDPQVFVERFGTKIWTFFNDGKTSKAFTATIDLPFGTYRATDLLTGKTYPVTRGVKQVLKATLEPEDSLALKIERVGP